MSVKIQGLVWDRYPEGGGELILALKLADNAHHDGTHIFPSVKTMSEMTRQSRRTVQYQLRRMTDAGWLILVKPGRGGRGEAGYAAEYRISPEWIKGADFSELSTAPKKKGANSAPNKEKGAIDGKKGCNPEQERVQSTTQKGATAIAPQPSLTVIEPSENHPAAQTAGGAHTTRFEKFWQTWPASQRKVDKADCRKHWEKHKLDAVGELIVAHVSAMKLTKQWKEGFEPAPATYLNGRRWEDELPPAEGDLAARELSSVEWWLEGPATEAYGPQIGLRAKHPDEPLPHYRVLVAKAAGKGPWIDYVLKHAEKSGSQKFYEWVRAQLGDGLLPSDDYAS